MDNKHMKRCSLVIKEIQIKTTMRYQMILTRTVIFFKKWTVTSVDEDVEKLEPTAGGVMKQCNHCGNSTVVPLKIKKELPYNPGISLLGTYPKN